MWSPLSFFLCPSVESAPQKSCAPVSLAAEILCKHLHTRWAHLQTSLCWSSFHSCLLIQSEWKWAFHTEVFSTSESFFFFLLCSPWFTVFFLPWSKNCRDWIPQSKWLKAEGIALWKQVTQYRKPQGRVVLFLGIDLFFLNRSKKYI